MKILVTAKRVTDPEMKIIIKSDGSGIELSSMKYKINPFDEIAIEEGLRIKEAKGGEVVIVSIGTEESQLEIRSGLSMGCDRGVLVVSDDNLDSDTVARILFKVIEDEKPNLVLMGKQAVDIDDNQCAQLLAEYLGWGQACFASKIDIDGTIAKVHREVDGGTEVVEIDLPGIISTDLRLNEPRYAKLPDVLKAKKKEIKKIFPAELGVDTTPKVVIKKFAKQPQRKSGRIVEDIAELVSALKDEVKII
ncbi:MAG: electron transfer flavoprotein subunit beta/FixA family protein [Desulfobacterales bacterium]|nr:electron transfer flavoprotein subunit beta/FixA family protein [Desulfobacterales bacterium]